MMTATLKICLYPTKEQEKKMIEACNVSRFVYNWALGKRIEHYGLYAKSLGVQDLITMLQELKYSDEYYWLNNVAECVTKQSIKDLVDAFKKFFNRGNQGFPKFKKKGRCTPSFYQRTDKIYMKDGKVNITNIGKIKVSKNQRSWFPSRPLNPRVKFDGKHWYLTVSYELSELSNFGLIDEVIGIDLGIKTLATCSNGVVYKGVDKEKNTKRHIKRLEKRLKHLQRLLSKKYEVNKKKEGVSAYKRKSNNILKLENEIRLIHRRISNIRDNYIHTITNEIVKTKPSKIVIEDLNVRGMMKNRHLAKAIQSQCFNKVANYLEYKCRYYGVTLVKANRWFASSKICSSCGNKKEKLSLSERTYVCDCCGLVLDRDLNASKNLANYIV